ncbi:8-amino-7-oxononanoate synthase [Amycolatopsis samaneae]|uniref:8-amino-7-oxononanoate synthase n=1 Tax=Amycolatopsis samaneae TaxID=664691 RepID=A0ABW5GBT2_9PSEU
MNAPVPPQLPPDEVFDWLDAEAEKRAGAGLTRKLRPRPAVDHELDLAGNDYLGLARDKRVAGAAAAAALRWGAGATGSRTGSGSLELHTELEHELARFCGAQAALVFSSGFTANLGAITALSGADAAIVTDKHLHPALIEGCRLSRADVAAVAHATPSAIKHALATRRKPRALVVTDAVFSADGDLAALGELAGACRAHGAALLVNDALGFGVLGEGGRGAVHAAGLAGAPDVVTTVTLANSLGAQGGAVLGPRRVIRHLAESARSFLFDTALAPGSAAAALAALGVLRAEPALAAKAIDAAGNIAGHLKAAGFRVELPEAAVVSVRVPSPEVAVSWAEACAEQGVRVGCLRPPSVPDGVCRLRITARADLTESDVDKAVKVLSATAPHGATS